MNFNVTEKIKSKNSNIKSAFLSGNTKQHILTFYQDNQDFQFINEDEVIRLKFEVDIDPANAVTYEDKFGLLPSPYKVKLFDLQSLFAGKFHACLFRN